MVLYVTVASLYILFSDYVLSLFTSDVDVLNKVQTYKGLAFVVTTGAMLYFYILHQMNSLDKEKESRQHAELLFRDQEMMYKQLFLNSGEAVLLTEPSGKIISANPAACALFGKNEEDIRACGREGIADMSDPRMSAAVKVRETTGSFHGELTFLRSDGTKFPAECSTNFFKDQSGRVRTNMIIRDLTEQKRAEREIREFSEHLERRVKERTAELNEANRELESFNYSVSHDLRAPVRAIDGYSAIILEENRGLLPNDAATLLQNIRASTKKMDQLINGLLNLSRIGRQEVKLSTVSMDVVVQNVLKEVIGAVCARTNVTVHPLPSCECDEVLITQVWHNLISNAVKYTAKNERAQIEIGAVDEGPVIRYFVKDNGVGFNMAHIDKLFGIFQRLHGSDQFEGIGIGLSIVKRIVTRFGGTVSAEGEEGKGAKISFTLKKAVQL